MLFLLYFSTARFLLHEIFFNSILDEAPTETYTSSRGFYIRIQKPVETGHVNFTYGVFQESNKRGTHLFNDCFCVNHNGKFIPIILIENYCMQVNIITTEIFYSRTR